LLDELLSSVPFQPIFTLSKLTGPVEN